MIGTLPGKWDVFIRTGGNGLADPGPGVWQWLAVFLLLALLMLALPAKAARITGVSTAAQGSDVQVLVELDGGFAAPTLFYLDGPPRIVVDFPGTRLAGGSRTEGSGPVKSVRLAQNTPEQSRLVIDLAEGAVATVDPVGIPGRHGLRLTVRADQAGYARALKQGRRVLAVATPPQGVPAQTAQAPAADAVPGAVPEQVQAAVAAAVQEKTPAPMQTAAAAPAPASHPVQEPEPVRAAAASSKSSSRKPLPIVVIDAGHGGQDPGAPSIIAGKWEKEVTLAIAKAIKEELDRSGKVKAVLTRSTDIFIPLGRRVDIARAAGANLFISIHADSIARPDVHGATVYTLSETASDKEAERLAAKENKADIIAGINLGAESQDVTDILIDLVQRETKNLSAEFAGHVVREVGKYRYFRSNNHRFAGFRVLKAPDVPSVLLETGYMSNLEDSKFLFSEAGQRAIAKGVRAAVEAYFQRTLARNLVAAGAP